MGAQCPAGLCLSDGSLGTMKAEILNSHLDRFLHSIHFYQGLLICALKSLFLDLKKLKKKLLEPCSVITWLKGSPEGSMLSRPGLRLLGLNFCHDIPPSRGFSWGSAFLAATCPFLEKRLFWEQARSQNRRHFSAFMGLCQRPCFGCLREFRRGKRSPRQVSGWFRAPGVFPVGHVLTSAFCKKIIFN